MGVIVFNINRMYNLFVFMIMLIVKIFLIYVIKFYSFSGCLLLVFENFMWF